MDFLRYELRMGRHFQQVHNVSDYASSYPFFREHMLGRPGQQQLLEWLNSFSGVWNWFIRLYRQSVHIKPSAGFIFAVSVQKHLLRLQIQVIWRRQKFRPILHAQGMRKRVHSGCRIWRRMRRRKHSQRRWVIFKLSTRSTMEMHS